MSWVASPSTSSRSGTRRTTGRPTRSTIGEGANIGAGTIFANYDGVTKHHTHVGRHSFVGSDTVLIAPVFVRDVFDVMARKRLHFDHSHETGVVFHMLSCVTECGRLGMTAIGDSPEQAWDTYQAATTALLEEGALARTPVALPT